ncbi:hypothetical protein H4CHR_00638 [Variovorax sp. PBS-H4]|uniref:hypothetical protein n=1 Tax=Variovorax sp. PBS-H4 TaxID=434008 RepID=UPI001316D7B2|nr:hypothetical protein [Variovorax sp. PBS-H4]VTU20703.1 hypothetical protein H4CHR_00638 [Variovorax sp. PBS-H4]
MDEPCLGASAVLPNERRVLLNRLCALATVGLASGSATLAACGGGGGGGGGAGGIAALVAAPAPGASPPPAPAPAPAPAPSPATTPAPAPAPEPEPAPAPAPAAPALGAHDLAFNLDGVSSPSLSISAIDTQASGSTLLVCVGRGLLAASLPTDNAGNSFVPLGMPHTYTLWPSSGTALYGCVQAHGRAGHVLTAEKPKVTDETTLSVVEIINGGAVRDVQWREVLSGQSLTSASVTTTGPALLVAWWWGDAGVDLDKTAVPGDGFTVIDSVLASGALVQCAVASRQVDAAGTYNVTWTSTPPQGAQLWLAAVQAA